MDRTCTHVLRVLVCVDLNPARTGPLRSVTDTAISYRDDPRRMRLFPWASHSRKPCLLATAETREEELKKLTPATPDKTPLDSVRKQSSFPRMPPDAKDVASWSLLAHIFPSYKSNQKVQSRESRASCHSAYMGFQP